MAEIWNEVWGELYWNTSDWLLWLAPQALFAAALAGVAQWWFSIRWPLVFTLVLTFSVVGNFARLPPSAISSTDIAKMNAFLPHQFDGVTMTSVSFEHRVLTFQASSPEPLEPADLKKYFNSDSSVLAEQCKVFGKWLISRQIKRLRLIWSWTGGSYTHFIEGRHCQGNEQLADPPPAAGSLFSNGIPA